MFLIDEHGRLLFYNPADRDHALARLAAALDLAAGLAAWPTGSAWACYDLRRRDRAAARALGAREVTAELFDAALVRAWRGTDGLAAWEVYADGARAGEVRAADEREALLAARLELAPAGTVRVLLGAKERR